MGLVVGLESRSLMVRDISTMRGRGSGGEGRTARLVGRAARPATGLEEREREREKSY